MTEDAFPEEKHNHVYYHRFVFKVALVLVLFFLFSFQTGPYFITDMNGLGALRFSHHASQLLSV